MQRWVVEHRVGVLDPVFEGLTYAGSFGAIWLVLAIAVAGKAWRRPWLPARVAVAILFAEIGSGLLKLWIGRDRPPLATADPEPLVGLPGTNSFPSGHATVGFACATTIALALPRLAPWLFGLAALIAFSRVYVGVHYPLDVLAGAALGVALALALRRAGRVVRSVALRVPRTPPAGPPRSGRAPPRD